MSKTKIGKTPTTLSRDGILTEVYDPDTHEQSENSCVSADQNVSHKSLQETSLSTSIEIGGPKGPEPTRFGDWEVNGRCSDF